MVLTLAVCQNGKTTFSKRKLKYKKDRFQNGNGKTVRKYNYQNGGRFQNGRFQNGRLQNGRFAKRCFQNGVVFKTVRFRNGGSKFVFKTVNFQNGVKTVPKR